MLIVYSFEIAPVLNAWTTIEPPCIVPAETNPAKILLPFRIKLAGKQPKYKSLECINVLALVYAPLLKFLATLSAPIWTPALFLYINLICVTLSLGAKKARVP